MKLIAAVFADFVETFLGRPARLGEPLGSASVLVHTLRRTAAVEGLAERCLVVRPRDAELAAESLRAAGLAGAFRVVPSDDGVRPRAGLLRCARKWNLSSWRGGPLCATWFDEYAEPGAVVRLLGAVEADAVLCLDGHQAALDPHLAGALVTHQQDHAADADICFSQAPPGLSGVILTRELATLLTRQNCHVGIRLGYRPEAPRGDPITRPGCAPIEPEIVRTAGRFTADTDTSFETLRQAFAELGEHVPAAALCAWWQRRLDGGPVELPEELELELTTADPRPQTRLYPRGSRVPPRHLQPGDGLRRRLAEFTRADDRLVLLGGHGDPLLHPHFAEICGVVRSAGVCGLAVNTSLAELGDAALEALVRAKVDVVLIQLDAHTPTTYARLHGIDAYPRVLDNIERIQALRRARTSPPPLLIPRLTRCAETLDELEAFFDHWLRTLGAVAIDGHAEYGGALPPDSLLALTPPLRSPCRRLRRRMLLLADGRTPLCDQDVAGATSVGDWRTTPLVELWRGAGLTAARAAHARGTFEQQPLCARCGEWFRP